jgi:DNA gyrase subunit A
VADADHLMLVTDGGKVIRIPVDGIRIAGRNTQGVIVFKTADDEKVVSAARLEEDEEEDGAESDTPPEPSEQDADASEGQE